MEEKTTRTQEMGDNLFKFLDTIATPMQKGKARKTLLKTVRTSKSLKAGPRHTIIEELVLQGYRVVDNKLTAQEGSFFSAQDITQTAIDYAKFLIKIKEY